MLKRKSMKQLFAAAYFLILLFSYKCFPYETVKGRAYVSNPFIADNPVAIFLADVDISYSFNANHHLTFFQISLLNTATQTQFILIQNSQALLDALNQALLFSYGVELVEGAIPDFEMPVLVNGALAFYPWPLQRMGYISGAQYRKPADGVHLRKYYHDGRKILGVLSADEGLGNKGPLGRLFAFSFGGVLFVRVKSSFADDFELHPEKYVVKKDHEDDYDQGGQGDGNAKISVNYMYSADMNNTIEGVLATRRPMELIELLELKTDWLDSFR